MSDDSSAGSDEGDKHDSEEDEDEGPVGPPTIEERKALERKRQAEKAKRLAARAAKREQWFREQERAREQAALARERDETTRAERLRAQEAEAEAVRVQKHREEVRLLEERLVADERRLREAERTCLELFLAHERDALPPEEVRTARRACTGPHAAPHVQHPMQRPLPASLMTPSCTLSRIRACLRHAV